MLVSGRLRPTNYRLKHTQRRAWPSNATMVACPMPNVRPSARRDFWIRDIGSDGKSFFLALKIGGVITLQGTNILLMEEILHQLICSLSHYLQGFIHPRLVQDFFHRSQEEQKSHSFLRGSNLMHMFFGEKFGGNVFVWQKCWLVRVCVIFHDP